MEKAGIILKKIIDENLPKDGKKYSAFFRSWEKIAGENLCAHTRVVEIEKKHLIIDVDHPGWMQLFQFKEKQILRKIKKDYPELDICAIKVRLLPQTLSKAKTTKNQDKKNTDDKALDIKPEDKALFKNIKDNELKESLKKLYSHVLNRKTK